MCGSSVRAPRLLSRTALTALRAYAHAFGKRARMTFDPPERKAGQRAYVILGENLKGPISRSLDSRPSPSHDQLYCNLRLYTQERREKAWTISLRDACRW